MSDIPRFHFIYLAIIRLSISDEQHSLFDAVGDEGPEARDALVATYASCFQGVFQVGGQRWGYENLGELWTDAFADIDGDDHLEAIHFSIRVEADLNDEELNEILTHARGICHVHDAPRGELEADIEYSGRRVLSLIFQDSSAYTAE